MKNLKVVWKTLGGTKVIPCKSLAEVTRCAHAIVGLTPTLNANTTLSGPGGTIHFEGCYFDDVFPHLAEPDEPPTCSMCDGVHGGPFCPLEDTGWDQCLEPWWAQ